MKRFEAKAQVSDYTTLYFYRKRRVQQKDIFDGNTRKKYMKKWVKWSQCMKEEAKGTKERSKDRTTWQTERSEKARKGRNSNRAKEYRKLNAWTTLSDLFVTQSVMQKECQTSSADLVHLKQCPLAPQQIHQPLACCAPTLKNTLKMIVEIIWDLFFSFFKKYFLKTGFGQAFASSRRWRPRVWAPRPCGPSTFQWTRRRRRGQRLTNAENDQCLKGRERTFFETEMIRLNDQVMIWDVLVWACLGIFLLSVLWQITWLLICGFPKSAAEPSPGTQSPWTDHCGTFNAAIGQPFGPSNPRQGEFRLFFLSRWANRNKNTTTAVKTCGFAIDVPPTPNPNLVGQFRSTYQQNLDHCRTAKLSRQSL